MQYKRGVAEAVIADVRGTVISRRSVHGIGDDAAGQALCDLIVIGNVRIDDETAVRGDQLRKFPEGTADIGKILKKVQMIFFYIKDKTDRGEEA